MKNLKLNVVIGIIALSIVLSSCSSTMHTVGSGGRDNCRPGHYDAKKKQWYLFWGILPLNNVDSKDLAAGAQNYTIRTTTSFGDIIIGWLLSPFLGLKTQTIRVSKGAN